MPRAIRPRPSRSSGAAATCTFVDGEIGGRGCTTPVEETLLRNFPLRKVEQILAERRHARHPVCYRGAVSSDNVIRTQISLDEEEYALVKKEAEALGISVAELVRRMIRQALPPPGKPSWMRFAGFVESGDSQSSQSMDEILNGSKE